MTSGEPTGLRIAIGGFLHETNTFAPMPTTYADFANSAAWPGVTAGAEMFETFRGANLPIGGFIEAAREAELVPLLWAHAEPGGRVEQAAFDRIARQMLEMLEAAGPIDAVFLDLHGAMATERHDDGEGELLRRVRALVGPDLPIVASLDLHGNLTPAFAELISAATIYRTYPHIDMAETGARAFALLRDLLARGRPFEKAYRQLDYLTPITAQSTMREPAARLYGLLDGLTGPGVASLDLALGFPPADIRDCGASILAYGSDAAAVAQAADAMLEAMRAAETAFVNPIMPVAAAVAEAIETAASAIRPVVIADPQDNPGAGSPGDTTGLLRALIEQDAPDACLAALWDPEAAAASHAAGVGARIELDLGGRALPRAGAPVRATVRVEALSDGVFPYSGPMYGGTTAHLGPMARLRILSEEGGETGVEVIVSSMRAQNADQETFRALGVEPRSRKILGIKSAVHFLADYEPIAETVLFAAAPGANPCKLDEIPYRALRPGVRLGPCGPSVPGGDGS